jgi:sirohydrochlorin cobaltochelatase
MKRGIVLFGHGSRDPAWREPMDAVAARVRAQSPGALVKCAFLELQQPSLPLAVEALAAAGVREVTVLPMFLGVGKHAREDLPRLVDVVRARYPELTLVVLPSVGESGPVLDLLAILALQHASS